MISKFLKTKKFFSLLILFVFSITIYWLGTSGKIDEGSNLTTSQYWTDEKMAFDYNGSETNPQPIYNAYELAFLADRVNKNDMTYATGHYKLVNDIDLEGKSWIPIGLRGSIGFRGTIDGQGYLIKNMKVYIDYNRVSEFICSGFIGSIAANVRIENLNISNAYVEGVSRTSLLIGAIETDAKVLIKNCSTSGEIKSFNAMDGYSAITGGMVGLIMQSSDDSKVIIENSYSNIIMTGSSTNYHIYAGGLVGSMHSRGNLIIFDSYAHSKIIANNNISNYTVAAGGILGNINEGVTTDSNIHFQNIYADAEFEVKNNHFPKVYIGNIIGYNRNNSFFSVTAENVYQSDNSLLAQGNSDGTENSNIDAIIVPKEKFIDLDFLKNALKLDFKYIWNFDETSNSLIFNNYYEINFNSDGGNYIPSKIRKQENMRIYSPVNPTKEGYFFAGWYTDENILFNFNKMGNKDILLTARWTNNSTSEVIFDSQGGTSINNTLIAFNSPYAFTVPNREGYTFTGWWDSKEEGKQLTDQFGSSIGSWQFNTTITVYAQWKINQYTIAFETSGGTKLSSITANYQSNLADLEPEKPVKEGYTFADWRMTINNVTVFDFKTRTMPSSNITLYARWIAKVTVINYETNGGNILASTNVNFNSTYTLKIPKKEGYLFLGWMDKEIDGVQLTYANGTSINKWNLDIDTYLVYALWSTESITITYNTDGGTLDRETIVINISAKFKLGIPTKQGYTFLGWEDEQGNLLTNNQGNSLETFIEEDCEVYAIWKKNSYSITYVSSYGLTTILGTEIEYGEHFTTIKLERIGYIFDGWWDATLTIQLTDKEGNSLAPWQYSNITKFYAKWTPITYKLMYNVNGGNELLEEELEVKYDASYEALTPTHPEGLIFIGWSTSLLMEDLVTSSNGRSLNKWELLENKNIYAIWDEALSYQITRNANGGISVSNIAVIIGKHYDLGTTTRNGYDFLGWFSSATNGEQYTDEFGKSISEWAIEKDTIVYAQWSPKPYKITFIVNGGIPINDLYLGFGNTIALPIDVQRDGYMFDGWYSNQELTTKFTITKMPEYNLTVYAKWKTITYRITYDTNGGEDLNPSYKDIPFNSTYQLDIPVKEGYVFIGWYDEFDNQYTDNLGKSLVNWTETEGKVFIAYWSNDVYTIKYQAVDTSLHNQETKVAYGYKYTLVVPNKEGYTFIGWYNEALNFAYTNALGVSLTAFNQQNELNVYASWEANKYYIIYNTDGGNVEENSKIIEYNKAYKLEKPQKEGYTFLGWFNHNYTEAYTDNEGNSKTNWNLTTNIMVYAKWQINQYTISFDSNGGTIVGDITKNYNEVIAKPTNPTKEGYEFVDWYTSDNQIFIWSTMPAKNGILTAKWQPSIYNITYYLNGGVNHADNPSTYTIETITITLLEPAKNGYHFDGWYKEINFETLITSIPNNSKDHVNLYAKWIISTYTISYVLDQGINSVDNPYTYTIITENIILINPTKLGYSFDGWYKESGYDSASKISTILKGSTGDLTLYAKWKANTYLITFITNGGIGNVDNLMVTYDSTYSELPNITKVGYEFIGWFIDRNNIETQIKSTDTVKIIENIVLHAIWTEKEYRVSFDSLNEESDKYILFGTSYGTLPIVNQVGYEFIGWFTSKSGGVLINEFTIFTHDDNQILYPRFMANKYFINFITNGAENNIDPIVVFYGEVLNNLPKVEKFGYTFAGWWLNGIIEIKDLDLVEIYSNATLFAKWSANKVNITFDCIQVELTNKEFNTTYGILPMPTKKGNHFLGWYLEEKLISDNTLINHDQDHELTARWKEVDIRVSYNTNGATEDINANTFLYGSKYYLPTLTKVGYIFKGWKLENNLLTNESIIELDINHTLNAIWEENEILVSFDLVGGIGNGNDIKIKYNQFYILPTITKVGYKFIGWYLNEQLITNQTTLNTAVNHTLKAKWQANSYRLSYNTNGANEQLNATIIKYNEQYNLPSVTKNGYTFEGWKDQNGKMISSLSINEIASNQVITAIFAKN